VSKIYADAAACANRAAIAVNSGDETFTGAPVEAMADWAGKSAKRSGIDNMIALARTEPEIVASPAAFDSDHFLLNVLNGTIDLRTGDLRPHNRADMITKLAPVEYDAGALAVEFQRYLDKSLPDLEVRKRIQLFLGYSLTGSVREQEFDFWIGKGGNGKNVLADVVCAALGDYAMTGAPELLLEKKNEAHPTELADLEGRRLVVCSEIEQGRAWAEARIKQITGDRTIKARRMKQDFIEFPSTSKLIVLANTKPRVRGTDDGIWRRMRLVPWAIQVPKAEQDKGLLDRLIADELPGVLAWLVRGCLEWQQHGLPSAKAIDIATADYRADQDVLGLWIRDRCRLDSGAWQATDELHKDYLAWCTAEHIERPWARRTFRDRLLERSGISDKRTSADRCLTGIRLLGPSEAVTQ